MKNDLLKYVIYLVHKPLKSGGGGSSSTAEMPIRGCQIGGPLLRPKRGHCGIFFACKSSSTTFNGANYIRVFYCRSFGRITVMRSAEVSSLECGGYLDSLTRKKSSSKPKYINYIP